MIGSILKWKVLIIMCKLNLNGLTGKVVTKSHCEYGKARQEWNRSVQKFPLIIVYCYTKYDVSNAIIWARKKQVDIRIRSGGHHYEGYSVGNNVIVIDISKMDRLEFTPKKQTLKIQGGTRNEQVYDFISSKGYPFPGGTCPTVGVSGYTLGGGWGYSCRNFGLGCDSLIEIELVDYKGRLIVANKKCHSNLFWACRGGGGGNFGVIVSMTFKIPPKVDKITLIEVYWPKASPEIQRAFLQKWQKWLVDLDYRITLGVSLYNSANEGLAIYGRGIFYGTPEEARDILQSLVCIEGGTTNLEYIGFLDAMKKIEASYPKSEQFKSTGRFVHRYYNDQEIENIIHLIQDRPRGSIFAAISLYALGGKVNEINKNDTAFFYRDAHYILGIQSIWEEPIFKKDNVKWVEQRFSYIKTITNGSFINFPYSELKDYMCAYYGENSERLKEINKEYDPCNIFTFPQGIQN